jgi:hypothetical protein
MDNKKDSWLSSKDWKSSLKVALGIGIVLLGAFFKKILQIQNVGWVETVPMEVFLFPSLLLVYIVFD